MTKKRLRKAVVGVSALMTAAAMTATALPAYASEVEVQEAESYVASLEDAQMQAMAQGMLDEGLTLDETQELIGLYTTNSTTSSTVTYPCYSATKLVDSEHCVCVIQKESASNGELYFKILYKYNNATFEETHRNYDVWTSLYLENPSYSPTSSEVANNTLYKGVVVALMGGSTVSHPSLFYSYDFSTGKVASEKEFHDSFVCFDYVNGPGSSGQIAQNKVAFETVARGDVNHDGVLDYKDVTAITTYAGETSSGSTSSDALTYTFGDGSTHYTELTGRVSGDYNGDGKVNFTDAQDLLTDIS